MSCSAEGRYKVLDFLFDGVPDPNAVPVPSADVPDSVDFTQLTSAERAEYLARRVEAPTVYFHPPVRDRLCDLCHVFEKRGDNVPGWMGGIPRLVVPIEELCAKCHNPPEAKYVHGPVAMMRCDICHLPHQSAYPHLLKVERVADLCTLCHQGETFVTEAEHAEKHGDEQCTACHDPHSSERSYYLLEATGELGDPPPQPPQPPETGE